MTRCGIRSRTEPHGQSSRRIRWETGGITMGRGVAWRGGAPARWWFLHFSISCYFIHRMAVILFLEIKFVFRLGVKQECEDGVFENRDSLSNRYLRKFWPNVVEMKLYSCGLCFIKSHIVRCQLHSSHNQAEYRFYEANGPVRLPISPAPTLNSVEVVGPTERQRWAIFLNIWISRRNSSRKMKSSANFDRGSIYF